MSGMSKRVLGFVLRLLEGCYDVSTSSLLSRFAVMLLFIIDLSVQAFLSIEGSSIYLGSVFRFRLLGLIRPLKMFGVTICDLYWELKACIAATDELLPPKSAELRFSMLSSRMGSSKVSVLRIYSIGVVFFDGSAY